MPLAGAPLLSGFFSHGIAEVSLASKFEEPGALLQCQVFYWVADGNGNNNSNLVLVYPSGTGVFVAKDQPVYIHMLHEVFASAPEKTIYEAESILSYIEQ